MYEKRINKMIERFREAKNSKGLTEEQVSEISGVPLSWVKSLFNGEVENPEFCETMDVASAVGVTPAEIDGIFNQCVCYIGIYLDCDSRGFMTLNDFYCEEKENFECFKFCPKCGKKIDWDAIIENC